MTVSAWLISSILRIRHSSVLRVNSHIREHATCSLFIPVSPLFSLKPAPVSLLSNNIFLKIRNHLDSWNRLRYEISSHSCPFLMMRASNYSLRNQNYGTKYWTHNPRPREIITSHEVRSFLPALSLSHAFYFMEKQGKPQEDEKQYLEGYEAFVWRDSILEA